MQSFADKGNDDHKKTKDSKSKISANYESDKKSANQHQDQDNFCYRGDDCEQANQGQQIIGKNNDAKGFNDQSDNLDLAALAAGNGTGTGNGTPTPPTPGPVVTPPVDGACVAPLVLATVTIGTATPISVCINTSLLGTLLPPVGGVCVAPLVAATITIGTATPINICVLPGIFA
jgi:hypothetical protein